MILTNVRLARLAAVGIAMLVALPARADFILAVDEGADDVDVITITDNSADDALDGTDGAIAFLSADSADPWSLLVTSGSSYPMLGNNTSNPQLDLGVADAISTGAGSIRISLTQTDFQGPLGSLNFVFGVGGTAQGGLETCYYLDPGNAAFGTGIELGCFTDTRFAFMSQASEIVDIDAPYSMTIVTTITHTRQGNTTLNAAIKLSEPSTLVLLGLSLAGLGFSARLRRARDID
ncbi:MAG: PEP-CTERM sorting domain-containing protein [Halioglobus sp.]